MKKVLLLILGLASLLLVSACTPAAPKVELPEGMIKLSELVPGHGEHWSNRANLTGGPIYLVHDDEVIGVEYTLTADLTEETFKRLPGLPVGTHVNHMDIEFFIPEGREGFEVPHFVVHLYFISAEKLQEELVPRPVGNNKTESKRRFE